jgi:hypothetical protein
MRDARCRGKCGLSMIGEKKKKMFIECIRMMGKYNRWQRSASECKFRKLKGKLTELRKLKGRLTVGS